MTILVFAEHDNETLSDQTAKAVDAAAKIGGDIHVLVAGKGAGAVAEAAGKLDGVTKVLHADGDDYAHGLAEPFADLIVKLADGYDVLLAPATTASNACEAAKPCLPQNHSPTRAFGAGCGGRTVRHIELFF